MIVSDSGARGRGSIPTLAVLCPRHIYSQKITGNTLEGGLHPDMTEKLLTGTLSINTNKTKVG